MPVTAVVGANWGDEGKGKLTDCLAADSDVVIRFQGGNNAGHTVINEYGKFALHLLPSGVFYPHVANILGNGVALNVGALLAELDDLTARKVPHPKLLISSRAQVVLPHHLLFDRCEEERLRGRQFGSTRQGIAPFYSDKYHKLGIQVADLLVEERLRQRVAAGLEIKNTLLEHLYDQAVLDVDDLLPDLLDASRRIEPYVCDTVSYVHEALAAGKRILVEGQLGALRDPDHGIYPFTTSSSPLAGYATVGAGVPPCSVERVIAVVKAYSSCVGAGPFVSEIFDQEAQELRSRGGDAGEYGATTGRPRRMGWFDAVATRYGCMVQGATEAALTLLDVLSYLDEIPVCTAYELDGVQTQDFPTSSRIERAVARIEKLPGWRCDISEIRTYDRLPKAAKDYVRFVQERIRVPIRQISNGPRRDQIMKC